MFKKANRYYADWRDRRGKRLRKSFADANTALRFEEEKKAAARPKARGTEPQSPRSSAPSSHKRRTNKATRAAARRRSPRRQAASAHRNSRRTT